MTVTGWVISFILLTVLVAVVTQTSRLMMFLLNLHRSERREYTEATRKVLTSLEDTIRFAAKTTNIFNADGTAIMSSGDKANVAGQNEGEQNVRDRTNETRNTPRPETG